MLKYYIASSIQSFVTLRCAINDLFDFHKRLFTQTFLSLSV